MFSPPRHQERKDFLEKTPEDRKKRKMILNLKSYFLGILCVLAVHFFDLFAAESVQ